MSTLKLGQPVAGAGGGMAPDRRVPIVTMVLLVAWLAPVPGCYRPRLVDCVLGCQSGSGCPSGMTCAAGLCTRGATCTVELAAGGRHSCAVRAGQVTCWGSNAQGQLGVAGFDNRGDGTAPAAAVSLGEGRKPISVAAGGRHTCVVLASEVDSAGTPGGGGSPAGGGAAGQAGTTVAPRTSGAVACWGDDSFGQVGAARLLDAASGVFPDGRPVSAVTAGLYHSCALRLDGAVLCWGDNRFGQLGVARVATAAGADGSPATTAPVDLAGVRAVAVTAGAYHTCALLEDGQLRCWGWNDYGQLGDTTRPGGDALPGVIAAVDLGEGRRAKAVAAGAFHSCALSDEGEPLCWGQNAAGQIGVPIVPDQRTVPPGNPVALGVGRSAVAIAAGASHSCAVLDDLSVKCWGFNGEGQLGVGHTTNLGGDGLPGDALPRVSLPDEAVSRISAGAHHTCVIQAAAVKCWGFGAAGRLGTGDARNRGDAAMRAIGPVVILPASPGLPRP